MASKKVTVYIGRFQPLHLGHCHVLERALHKSDLVIVLVGSAFQARTIKNPFTFEEREKMLRNWSESKSVLWDNNLCVLPLRDQPYNNAKWIQSVQELVQKAIEFEGWDDVEIVLTGSDRDDTTWYLNAFPQWGKDLLPAVPPGQDLSATGLRERLFSTVDASGIHVDNSGAWADVPSTSLEFLRNFVMTDKFANLLAEYNHIKKNQEDWKPAPHPVKQVTCDAIIIQSGHVLTIERANLPGYGLWALPGGHLNVWERIIDGIIRETLEETGLRLAEGKRAKEITEDILRGSLVGPILVFDDPYRSQMGRVITHCGVFRLDDTKPLPYINKGGMNVPLAESGGKIIKETKRVWWNPINEARARSEMWFDDHHPMLDVALGMLKD